MNRVLVLSEGDSTLGSQMAIFMETRLPYEVAVVSGRPQLEEVLGQKPVHLLVFETHQFTDENLRYLLDLRHLGYGHPVLVVSESVEAKNFLNQVDRLRMLHLPKPFEFRALRGLAQKLVVAKVVPQQMHRRYRTQQRAVLEAYSSGERHTSELFNLSAGGAYLEFSEVQPRLGIGELVRFQVVLDDLERRHSVSARVVWTTRKGMHHGGSGCGLRFIKGKDVFREFMGRYYRG